MLVPVVVALSTSPTNRPPTLTEALNTMVASGSLTVAETTETGVLFVEAGLLALSVKALFAGVTLSVGALSKAKPSGDIATVLGAIEANRVGAPPARLPL